MRIGHESCMNFAGMRELYEKLGYRPKYCVWEVTLRCNLSCLHCGSRAGKPRPDELTTEESLALVDELARLGCERLTLSGGEPTLRRDWPLLARRAVERQIECNLVTNGMTWDRDTAIAARDAGLANVGFSLDGTESTHDHIRNRRGSFDRLLAGLDVSAEVGLPTAVLTHVHRRDLDELEEIAEIAATHGAKIWQLQLGNPIGNMLEHRDLCIEPDVLLTLLPLLGRLFARYRGRMRVDLGDNIGYYSADEAPMREAPRLPFWTGCAAGMRVVGIESNGNVKGCLSQPGEQFVEGNLRQTPLAEIWSRQGAFAYNREFTVDLLEGDCRECAYARICRAGCRWTAFCQSGHKFNNPYCYHRVAAIARGKTQPRTGAAACGSAQAASAQSHEPEVEVRVGRQTE